MVSCEDNINYSYPATVCKLAIIILCQSVHIIEE